VGRGGGRRGDAATRFLDGGDGGEEALEVGKGARDDRGGGRPAPVGRAVNKRSSFTDTMPLTDTAQAVHHSTSLCTPTTTPWRSPSQAVLHLARGHRQGPTSRALRPSALCAWSVTRTTKPPGVRFRWRRHPRAPPPRVCVPQDRHRHLSAPHVCDRAAGRAHGGGRRGGRDCGRRRRPGRAIPGMALRVYALREQRRHRAADGRVAGVLPGAPHARGRHRRL